MLYTNEYFIEKCGEENISIYDIINILNNNEEIDINSNDENAFRNSFIKGNFHISKFLVENFFINISANNEEVFIYSCKIDNIEYIEWLLNINPNINININDYIIYKNAIDNKNFSLIIFLLNININRNFNIDIILFKFNKYIKDFFKHTILNNNIKLSKIIYNFNNNILDNNIFDNFIKNNIIQKNYLPYVKWLFNIKIFKNICSKQNYEYIFYKSCEFGNLKLAKLLYYNNINLNVHVKNEFSFRYACYNGHIDIIEWLLKIRPNINVRILNDSSFVYACYGGHLNIAKFLLNKFPDIDNFSLAYKEASKNKFFSYKVLDWLLKINPKLNI